MSLRNRLALWNARYVQKPTLAMGLPPVLLRALFAGSIRALNWVPRAVVVSRERLGGVPCRKVVPKGAVSGRVLLLHGGGFVIGGPGAYLPLAGKLAKAAMVEVWLPDYRLAPEHPYPAAPDDVLTAYKALSKEGPVTVAGDSAGGCLALGLLHQCVAEGIDGPIGLVLMSPVADLGFEAQESMLAGPPDALLSKKWAYEAVLSYASGADRADPVMSPLAAPFADAPPSLVQSAAGEALSPQIEATVSALRAAGAEVEVEIFEDTFHAFQIAALPLADQAIGKIAAFIKRLQH